MDKLSIEIYGIGYPDLSKIVPCNQQDSDSCIQWEYKWICGCGSPPYTHCQIPIKLASEFIDKILNDSYILTIKFFDFMMTEITTQQPVFKKFKELQSGSPLGDFDINCTGPEGHGAYTLLLFAVMFQDVNMADFLLESGTKNIKNWRGKTPREYVEDFGSEAMKDIFLKWENIEYDAITQNSYSMKLIC